MYNEKLNIKTKEIFEDLSKKAYEMINNTYDFNYVSQQIVDIVSSELTVRSKTMMIDLYSEISKQVLATPVFESAENKNLFYDMNLRKEVLDKYKFDVTSLYSFKKGVDYKEINKLYSSLVAAAGTGAVIGVLKYTLNNTIDVPIVVILAGALLAFCGIYFKTIPYNNKKSYYNAINKFLEETKSEFIAWFDAVAEFFNNRVEELIKTF